MKPLRHLCKQPYISAQGQNKGSPDARSTRMFFCWVTLMWAVTFPSFRANSSIPSARELKRSRLLGFQVRNWKPIETMLWSLLPGSCRKLVPLKNTGNVCVSTQEKVRFRWKWGRVLVTIISLYVRIQCNEMLDYNI